jgi:hypothetical protein
MSAITALAANALIFVCSEDVGLIAVQAEPVQEKI